MDHGDWEAEPEWLMAAETHSLDIHSGAALLVEEMRVDPGGKLG